jgi:nucleotide-binding universal stress UspA family protein
MTTTLVGYDDHPLARRALRRALDDAASGDRIVVLAVIEAVVEPAAPRSAGVLGDGPEVPAGMPEPPAVAAAFADARTEIGDAPVEVVYAWDVGDAAEAIVRVARAEGATRIVVGQGHHGAIAELLGADVAAEVRDRAPCEVVAVD